MKAIIIKYKDKPIVVEQLSDLTTKQFLDLKKEIAKNIKSYELFLEHELDRISQLEEHVQKLEEKCELLQHQINVITGIEEESEEQE